MSGPALVAVEEDEGALGDVERELRDRYARHYSVMCMRSPQEALAALEDLAAAGEQVAMVLAGQWLAGMTGSELLDRARHLHPHAKRGLLIPWGGWGDPATGEAIFDSIAHGRIHHYVLRPLAPADEVFHHAISSMLLGSAEARGASPHTIQVVGESWSGRAYELRALLGRCAMPHSFCLADSSDGRALVARSGRGVKAAAHRLPQRHGSGRSQQFRPDEGGGLAGAPREDGLRSCDRRRRARGSVGGCVWRVGGIQHLGRRRRRARGPGDLEFADSQLPRLPRRPQRAPSGPAGLRAGMGIRGELLVHAEGDRSGAREFRPLHHPLRRRSGAHPRRAPGDRRQLSPASVFQCSRS